MADKAGMMGGVGSMLGKMPMGDAKSVKVKVKFNKNKAGRKASKNMGRSAGR